MTTREKILLNALVEIRQSLSDRMMFDEDAFERRDIDGLCKTGGDVCDNTMLAILADDAIRKFDEVSYTTNNQE